MGVLTTQSKVRIRMEGEEGCRYPIITLEDGTPLEYVTRARWECDAAAARW